MKKILVILLPFLFMSCATVSTLGKVEENKWVSNTECWQATPSESNYMQSCVDSLMDYDAIKIGYDDGYDMILKESYTREFEGTYVHSYQTQETSPFSIYSYDTGTYVRGNITTTYQHRDYLPAVNQFRMNQYLFLRGFNWNIPKGAYVIFITPETVRKYFDFAKAAYDHYYDVGYHNGFYYMGHYLLGGWIYKLANKPTLPKSILKENENGN